MRVMLQMRPQPDVVAAVVDPAVSTPPTRDVAGDVPGVVLDPDFTPVAVPQPVPARPGGDPLSLAQPLDFSMAPEAASVLVRGEIQDYDVAARLALLATSRPDIVGISSDPTIETMPTCGGDAPVGDWRDVERALSDLRNEGLDGAGVPVAVVDTGINLPHLKRVLDREVALDASRSFKPAGVVGEFGQFSVGHGTMCAFDALIAAPKAELLDLPVLRSTRPGGSAMEGLLSDAVAAFAHLRTVLEAMPEERRGLIVNNSWGSFKPSWDFPPGNQGNYSDNPAHPFNLAVAALERAGADVLFAAGNCGRECPDGRCGFPDRPINGANSHPRVLSVAGVDTRRARVGYSSQGPGRLADAKPDLSAFTHFEGSLAFGPGRPDSGTSAACPVAAGVVAAVRTRMPVRELSPARMRTLLRRTAEDLGMAGYDYDYGYGIIDAPAIVEALRRRQKNGRP
ncbi:S8 family serine peptidase [Streptomyces sp. JJ36]|uniref:S8 family serine peptidase n=1 Tax=Streptomyces sp. JJ36 TaxID=2736645 RepID=UPI001F2F6397|nr:S8 family serine peptidase [Streptomyces sp. JJ36]MCF6525091.1 S8 family serine peptidase [Streptomyces sp. JJ36]